MERPRQNASYGPKLAPSEQACTDTTTARPQLDQKCLYLWRVCDPPAANDFPKLNAGAVVLVAFATQWAKKTDGWRCPLIRALRAVADILSAVVRIPRPTELSEVIAVRPYLLERTGVDLDALIASSASQNVFGAVAAVFHYDLNLLAIHGRAHFHSL